MTPSPIDVRDRRRGLAATAMASILGPAIVLLAIWLPEVLHYYVTTPQIGKDIVAELRSEPDDSVLARIDGVRFGLAGPDTGSRMLADEILAGRYHTREGEVVPVTLEPTGTGLEAGSPSAQLQVSSMVVAETLLAAYRETGERRYFDAALESGLGWARFERRAWIPAGFLWNDHAVAARVLVLTRLWSDYRKRADFDPDRGAEILAFVARSTLLLAGPSHYTIRTNHGIMQDLALLHAGIAFPRLPGTQERVGVALDRLAHHLPFYVGAGGVVLEHSAGYQDFAIRLLRIAIEYVDLLGVPGPPGLRDSYIAAECLQRHLTRPDGSLPAYGDTLAATRPEWLIAENAAVGCGTQPDARVDQDFGLASLRNFAAPGTQLFMTWADFAGRAHKHDDELATWLWVNGQDWWSASGYWPYGDADRSVAISWRGANAPHAAGEAQGSGGESLLLNSLREGPVQMLDVERKAPDGRAYRRQVLGLGPLGVLTLDSASGAGNDSRLETIWTLVPGVSVRPLGNAAASYELNDERSGRLMTVNFAGARQEVLRLFGSRVPFGGLVTRDGIIRPSEAIVVTVPFSGWSAALWGPGAPVALALTAWTGPERWSFSLAGTDGVRELAREDSELSMTSPREGRRSWRLEPAADARPLRERATVLYREAAARYPPFRDYVEYRLRATAGIGVILVVQYPILWLMSLLRVSHALRVTVLAFAWAGIGSWLYYLYLV